MEALLKIPFFKAIIIIIAVIYCIAPPIVYTFLLDRHLFDTIDIFKLILLSISFGALFLGVNFFIALLQVGIASDSTFDNQEIYSGAAIIVICTYSLTFLLNTINYLCTGEVFSIKTSIIIFELLLLVTHILQYVMYNTIKKQNKKNAKAS